MSRPHKTVKLERVGAPKGEFTKVRNSLLDDDSIPPAVRFAVIWLLRHASGWETSANRLAMALGVRWATADGYLRQAEEAGYLDRTQPGIWRVGDLPGSLKTGHHVGGKSENLLADNPRTKKTKEEDQTKKTNWPSPSANGLTGGEPSQDRLTLGCPVCRGILPGTCGNQDYHRPVPALPSVVPDQCEPTTEGSPSADVIQFPRAVSA